MKDTTHFDAHMEHLSVLNVMLSNERARLAEAKTKKEIEMRTVWVEGIEKEIANLKKFLGINDGVEEMNEISDDDLLSELLG